MTDNTKQNKTKKNQVKNNEKNPAFYIVGVGGSAGALPYFTELLKNVPADAGLSFVIIQHLLADTKSSLSEILAGKTKLPVKEVSRNTLVKSNHVYVIPPGNNIFLKDGLLKLSNRTHDGQNLPIDEFFVSLAREKKQNAIGVILSGTGSDGTLGMKAIREAGGITFAQNKDAAFPAMPNSVIAADLADYVYKPSEIANKLKSISGDPAFYFSKKDSGESHDLSSKEEREYHKILRLLLDSSNVDFVYYKQGTLKRRIKRRMDLKNIGSFEKYWNYLKNNPEEVKSLYQDILIKVTHFFRDQKVFDFLNHKIIPEIFKSQPTSVRVWVPGCSTGEEVYSLAITLADFLEKNDKNIPVQIFGTDISETALATARQAKYPNEIESTVPAKLLKKYFIKNENSYEILPRIRAMCIFAKHNIVKDVPFTKMDIVSCRNVLIYLDSQLQKKVFPIFNYALRLGGYLVLGTAETATNFQDLFAKIDNNHNIYTKKTVSYPPRLDFSIPNPPSSNTPYISENESTNIEGQADRIVLTRHAPAGVIVNDDLSIVQFRGDVSPYLKHPTGRATLGLVKMTHRTLLSKLLMMIEKARKTGMSVKNAHSALNINIEVIPLGDRLSKQKHFLILFEKSSASKEWENKQTRGKTRSTKNEATEMEEELSSTVDQLQSLIETRDATNEELRSAHEEIMSANEELQSANEELETTKEELQSTNEELLTLNSELTHRNVDLRKIEDSHKIMAPQFKFRGEELHRKDEFISILGHELRNPLAPIMQSVALAKLHGIKDPEIKQTINIIDRHAKLMNNIINDLLDVARAKSGKIQLQEKIIDFNDSINHAIESTQSLIKARQQKLELCTLNKPIYLSLDPMRIEQAIINLINNASKYTSTGGNIRLTITHNKKSVSLQVKDNGVGISKEMLPKIFDMFSQAPQSISDSNGGLGLGLMFARNLAELHGGSLTASSAGLGKGSEFFLHLPFKEEMEAAKMPVIKMDLKKIKIKKWKIIVVDDNIALANLMGKLFHALKQDVTVVYTGASVVELVKTNKPDLIFIDISMPIMSGYDLIKILRKDASLKKTTMMALSGFGEEYRERSMDAGFNNHLTKPVNLNDLVAILAQLDKK